MSKPQVYYWPSQVNSTGRIYSRTGFTSPTVLPAGTYLPLKIPQHSLDPSSTNPYGLNPITYSPDPNGSIDKTSGYPRHVLPNMWRNLYLAATGTSTVVVLVTGKGVHPFEATISSTGPITAIVPKEAVPVPLSVQYTVTAGTPLIPATELWSDVDNIKIVSMASTITALTIGYGDMGLTVPSFLDYDRINFSASGQIQIVIPNAADVLPTFTATPLITLTPPETVNPYVGKMDPNPSPLTVPYAGYPVSIPFFGVIRDWSATTPIQVTNSSTGGRSIFPLGASGPLLPATFTVMSVQDNSAEDIYYTVLQQGIRT